MNEEQQEQGSLRKLLLGSTPQGTATRAAALSSPYLIGKYNNMKMKNQLPKAGDVLPKKPKFLTKRNLGIGALALGGATGAAFLGKELYNNEIEKRKKWYEL